MGIDFSSFTSTFRVIMTGYDHDGVGFNVSGGFPNYYIKIVDHETDTIIFTDIDSREEYYYDNFYVNGKTYRFIVADDNGSEWLFGPIILPFTGILDENSELVEVKINDSPTLPIFSLGPPIINYGNYACDLSITLVNEFEVNGYLQNNIVNGIGTFCLEITGTTISPPDFDITITQTYPPPSQVVVSSAVTSEGTYCFEFSSDTCYDWIVVDDNTGCYYTGHTCIPQFTFTCDTVTYVNPSCVGCNGSVYVFVDGGYGPYIYNLVSGSTIITSPTIGLQSYNFTGVCEGTWVTTIFDVGTNITITCDTVTLVNNFDVNISSSGSCTGSGQYCITIDGGTAPYYAQLIGSGDSAITYYIEINNPGTYCYSAQCGTYDNIEIHDSSTPPCYIYTSITIPCSVNLAATTVGNPCGQTGQGSITITNVGGTPPFLYSIDGGLTFHSQNYFGALNSGTYNVVIKDAIPCTASTQVTILNTTNLDVTAVSTPENCNYTSGGTITVTVNNGTPPYQYSFNGGPYTSINHYTGLTIGTYVINVVDSLGCTGTVTVSVSPPISLSGTISTSESCAYHPALNRYYALKVESLINYLGNDALENQHINYVVAQGYEIFQSYGVSTIWRTLSATATSPQGLTRAQAEARLNVFLGKVYNAGLLPVALMGDRNDFDWIASVDLGHTNKFWGIGLENEFWNDPSPLTAFNSWIADVQYLRNKVDTAQFPPYFIMAYLANPGQNRWFAAQANLIVQAGIDVLELTNYTNNGVPSTNKPDPSSSSFVNMLNLLSTAAFNNNKNQKFIPLWSGEQLPANPYSGIYFGLNGPVMVPSNTITQYDIDFAAVSYAHPTNLTKAGFSVFSYNNVILSNVLPYGSGNSATPPTVVPPSIYTVYGTTLVNATGGNAPYQYSIDGGTFQLSNYFTGLTSGIHTIVVKDASGCTVTGTTEVGNALDVSANTTDLNCISTSSGTLDVTIGSGIPPFNISINGGPYTNNTHYTGLSAGTYTISVIDASGCSATTVVNINSSTAVSVSATSTNISCYGGSGGTITITANGGIPPYQYSINGGGTFGSSNYFTGLGVGSYNIVVKDVYGCSATTTASVFTATSITVSATSVTAATCSGLSTADLTLLVQGGTPPYRFQWSPIGATTQIVHVNNYINSPGTYTYSGTVLDVFGCSASTTVTFTILSADSPTLLILSAGTLSCDPNSYVTFSAITTGPYTDGPYWSNGQSGVLVITANTPGSYSYYVKNGANCIYSSDTITINYPTIVPPLIGYDATLCVCSSTNVTLLNNGHTYTGITWNNGSTGTSISVSSCTPTGYTFYLTAKDENGCSVTSNTVTVRFTDLAIDFYKNDAVCLDCGICIDGYAEIIILSGVSPYTYFWTGATNNSNVLNNAQPGHYVVTVVDGAGCSKTVEFDISGTTLTDCTYEPVKDGNGNIILNPDGTISFYSTTALPRSVGGQTNITNYSPSQDCCLSNSTIDLPLQYCDCKCYWKRPTCFSGETRIDKIILGGDGDNGVQLISQTPKNDQSIVCQYQASFDFLFNFDCQKLYDCVQNNYSGSVLTFLSGLSAYATIEVVSGTSYVTAQKEKIWSFDFNKQPTGVYFAGQSNFCQLLNDIIYDELGLNCTALTQTTFAAVWQHASFKIYDSLSGQTIKLGMELDGFNCEYNILLDNIKIEEVCVITTENLVTLDNGSVGANGACFGFQLDKVIDNKKSWVYNEDFYQRDWFHLKYRDTSYPDYDERLDINTKEIDLNISPSRAINYDIYCYALSQNCYTFSGCGNPNLILQSQFKGMGQWDMIDPTSYSGSMVSYLISPLTAGQQYDIHFSVNVIDNTGASLPPGFLSTLVIGFMSGNTTYILLDAITGVTNTGITTYNFTFTLNGPIINSNKFFIRLINGLTYRTYYVDINGISISLHCDPSNINPNNFITVSSGMTYDQFNEMMQTQLIDVKDRQSISSYPLLRYMYERYLGLCGVSVSGSSNCNVQSNQYNYSSLNNFIDLIGGYWTDLIEQFVPATTIWGGGGIGGGGSATSRSYANNMFDQPKFEYRNFSIGYCDSEYCFEGNTGQPSYSAACYVNLTPTAFSALSNSIFSSINSGTINDTIKLCASQSMLPCCNTSPLSCFVSAEFGFNFTEGNLTKSATTLTVTNLNSLPTSAEYLNMVYSGLYNLGYTNSYPSGTLQWSKPSTTGCNDPINIVPYVHVKYSCLTATTVANCNSTISYQTIFTGFSSTYNHPVNVPIITDLGTRMYGVGGGTTVGNSGGQYGDGYIWTYSISAGVFGIVKDFNLSVDGVTRPLAVVKSSVDGFLYGISSGSYFATTPSNPSFFKIDPNNPSNFSVIHTFSNNLTASPIGVPSGLKNMIQHSNGKIYFGVSYTSPTNRWGIYEFNVTTQTLTPLNLFNDIFNGTYLVGPIMQAIYLTEDVFTGYIYGTTTTGGQYGFGKIFRFNPNNPLGTYFVVHNFNGTINGSSSTGTIWPSGPPLRANSTTFYGLAADERSPATGQDKPYLDSIYTFNDNPTTNSSNQVTVTKLVNFSQILSNLYPCWFNNHPNGNLILRNNVLYGIANYSVNFGGSIQYPDGAIFQYDIGANKLTGVHRFNGGNEGGLGGVSYHTDMSWLTENIYNGKIYGITSGGGSNEYGTIYDFSYTAPTGGVSSGITIHECTILGSLVNISSPQLNKILVTYSSDTYVSGTSMNGLSCTDYCASYLDNPGVEVIVEDLTNLITNPCTDPPIVDQCNIVFAYHIDNDVWFNGSVTVTYPFNVTGSTSNGGAVLITETNAA